MHIYIVESQGYYKIGVASNLKQRLFGLQTGNPSPIEVVETFQFDNYSTMSSLEKRTHSILRNYNVRGEWFSLTDGELLSVRKLLRAGSRVDRELGEQDAR
jgi:hypothetical protein